jgi:hypothetical protein
MKAPAVVEQNTLIDDIAEEVLTVGSRTGAVAYRRANLFAVPFV